ncbi:lactonase family protein [Paenibacillus alkaliterrae]|uniref:lactonase family protein n=1 Tax=Paenibacillus alkaliterrae TaxID=320909 RepID=UPI001F3F137E|nr:lactonase family protein [Paenibacillus alkaliterrae]MCF2937705.1 lactonase family protein [Paenibacillus alkaliterrae]
MSDNNAQLSFNGVFYAGSYGDADEPTIHVCAFNGRTNELSVIQSVSGLENASYLALHPGGRFLYAVSETAATGDAVGGSAAAYGIEADTGRISAVGSRLLSYGAHPCYISTDQAGRALFAANYTGGNVVLFPLSPEGELAAASSVQRHEGELGPNAARQDAPHAHCITPLGNSGFVCAADLGLDAVIIYRYDAERLTLTQHGICNVHRGAGPRHLVFHPVLPVGYVLNELDSTITWLKVDAEQGVIGAGPAISALPAGYEGYNDAADIHLAPSGRYLYSSNRGHDSIAVFAVDQGSGALTLVQHIDCGGETPRNFAITPDGGHLLAAHQKSGSIAVFSVDTETGLLTATGATLKLPSPVCIKFADA